MAYQAVGAVIFRALTTAGGRSVTTQGARTSIASPVGGSITALARQTAVAAGGSVIGSALTATLGERVAEFRRLLANQVLVGAPRPGATEVQPIPTHVGVEAVLEAVLTLGKPAFEALSNGLVRSLSSGDLHTEENEEDDEDSKEGRLLLPCVFPVRTLTPNRPIGPALAAEAADWIDGLTAVSPNVPNGAPDANAVIFAVSGGHAGRIDALRYRSAVVGDLAGLLERVAKPALRNDAVQPKGGRVASTTAYHLTDRHLQILREAGALLGRTIAAHGRRAVVIDPYGSEEELTVLSTTGDRVLRFSWNLTDTPLCALATLMAFHRVARNAVLTAVGGGDGRAVTAALQNEQDPDQTSRVMLALSLAGISVHELGVLLVAGAQQYALLWAGLSRALGLQVALDPAGDVFKLQAGGTIVAREHVHALEVTTVPALRGDTFEPCDVVASVKRVVGDGLFVPQRADFMPDGTRELPARYSAGRRLHIRPGAVHSIVGTSGAGKTTLTRAICQVLQAEFGDKLKVVLIDCAEPLHDIPTSALASTLFGMDVEVVQLERAHPGLVDMVQLHLLERYPEHHIVVIIDSATGLLSEALGGGSGTIGAAEGGVNPLARPGLTALSRLVHPSITTMALFNSPSTKNLTGGYWQQIHGASTMSYLVDKRAVVGFRDRIGNTMFQLGGVDGAGQNMVGEYVSRTTLHSQRGIGDDTRYTG